MIDVTKSVVNMMAAKIEVAMKKAEPMSWARLDLPPPVIPPKDNDKKKEEADSDEEDEDEWRHVYI